MKAVFDTNILIDYLAGVEQAERELARFSGRAISLITWMETLAGVRNDQEADVVEMFLRDFELLPVTRQVGRTAVALRRSHRLRLPDAIIWASAQAAGAMLVTRNTKDFPTDDPSVRIPY